jgi:putative (di)nucleoside polyphosphate hydrolase
MSVTPTFPPPPQGYRPNVGLLLFDMRGLVWLGKRRGFNGQHAWQAPQGGIDRDEDVQAAALRELEEETGIGSDLVSVIGYTEDWISYEFPEEMQRGKYRRNKGQTQIWFALRFLGSDNDVRLNAHKQIEFDAWRWERLEALASLVVPFKRKVYEQVALKFAHLAAG